MLVGPRIPHRHHLLKRGKRVPREFSGTFTKYTTPKRAGELVTSGFKNADEKTYFKIPGSPTKTSIFLVHQYWKWPPRFLQHLMTQNRPFAFFRFTCFQAGSALYSSRVMSSANWEERKKCPAAEWTDPPTSHAQSLKCSPTQKKRLPRSPRRWDRSPASEGQLPQGAAWLGGRPVGKWSYTVWLRHPPLEWSDLKLPCPGEEEGAERGTSMSEHISSCAVTISPGPYPPQPSLRCRITSPPMGFHIYQLSHEWIIKMMITCEAKTSEACK